MLNDDMRAVIEAQRLCFAATVTPEGKPNLSPKGTVRAWDDSRIFFCDIASPGTRRNLESNPWMELNVVDTVSRRGYRFVGRAEYHASGPVFEEASRRIFEDEGAEYQIHGVVLLQVERAAPVVSPGYEHFEDELAIRREWKKRRAQLDLEFERHIAARGPWKGFE